MYVHVLAAGLSEINGCGWSTIVIELEQLITLIFQQDLQLYSRLEGNA